MAAVAAQGHDDHLRAAPLLGCGGGCESPKLAGKTLALSIAVAVQADAWRANAAQAVGSKLRTEPGSEPVRETAAACEAGVVAGAQAAVDGGCQEAARQEAARQACTRNIRAMFAYQLLNAVAWNAAMGPVFDKYLHHLGDGAARGPQLVPTHARNALVGLASSVSGLSSLLLAVPVGLLVDRRPGCRARLLRLSSGLGVAGALLLVAAVLTDYALLVYVALALLGAFSELTSSASEAIFADSTCQGRRSGLFTTKAVLNTLGVACGPAASAVLLHLRGDEWRPADMKLVIASGALLLPASCFTLFCFQDPPAARGPEAGASAGRALPHSRHFGPLKPSHVPYLLASSNFIACIGAGMTVKFVSLFFIEDLGFKPTQICLLQTAYPLVIAGFMMCTQSLSKPLGRSMASLMFFSLNVLCLHIFSEVRSLPLLVAVYLVRGGFANSTNPLDRSILMDFTPSSQRGRWNAVQSLTMMTWSGSAFLGGLLSDSHDYRFTFAITAAVYALACVVYAPLLVLVPRSNAARASPQGDEAREARAAPARP